jgi:hypothetical protein
MPATYEPIATQTLGSAAASVTFSSITSTYTDLKIIITMTATAGSPSLYLRYNGDTGTNYSTNSVYGDGTNAGSFRASNENKLYIGELNTTIGTTIVDVMNYSNTTTNKTCLARNSMAANVQAIVGLWRNTSAINEIVVLTSSSTFIVGSTFTLYGIKAA